MEIRGYWRDRAIAEHVDKSPYPLSLHISLALHYKRKKEGFYAIIPSFKQRINYWRDEESLWK